LNLWLDWFGILVAVLVAAVYFIDFLIGEEGNKKVRSGLLVGWYYFSKIPVRALGAEEVRFTLGVFDNFVGDRLFSWRRLGASLVIVCVGIATGYLLIEHDRWVQGLPFQWPFSPSHFRTGFPTQLPSVMISLSITRWILAWSVNNISGTFRLAWLLLPTYAALALITYVLADAVSGIVALMIGVPLNNLMYHFTAPLTGEVVRPLDLMPPLKEVWVAFQLGTNLQVGDSPNDAMLHFLPLLKLLGRHIVDVHQSPITYFDLHMNSARAGYPGILNSLTIGWIANGLRIGIGAAFVGSWILAFIAYRPLELILRRLAESDRAPLGHIALGLGGVAKLIQVVLKPGIIEF
jgi:hypothetical protein